MPEVHSLLADDLKHLGAERSVEFFRWHLWSESSRVGVGQHLIHVPANINEGDGGIDAAIYDAVPADDGLAPHYLVGISWTWILHGQGAS